MFAETTADPARLSMAAFIVFSSLQIFCFIFKPHLLHQEGLGFDFEKDPFVFYSLIGLKEVGLMIFYTSFVVGSDRTMMLATSLGRLSTLVYGCWLVICLQVPPTFFFALLPDVLFGVWTLWALLALPAPEAKPKPKPTPKQPLVDVMLVAAGCFEIICQ